MPSLRQSVATSTRFGASPSASTRSSRSAGGSAPGDGLDLDAFGSFVAERVGDVVGGRDEAAEDDRVVAVVEQLLDELDRPAAASGRRRRRAPRRSRASALRRRRFGSSGSSSCLGVGARGDVDALGDLVVDQVEDVAAPISSASSTVAVSAVGRGCAASRRRQPGSTRASAAARAPPTSARAGGAAPARPGRRRSRARTRGPARRALGTPASGRTSPRVPRASGKRRVAEVVLDVAAAALDEVPGEPAALARPSRRSRGRRAARGRTGRGSRAERGRRPPCRCAASP